MHCQNEYVNNIHKMDRWFLGIEFQTISLDKIGKKDINTNVFIIIKDEMELKSSNGETRGMAVIRIKSDLNMRILTHEMGHTLLGHSHSEDPHDIMYPYDIGVEFPSERELLLAHAIWNRENLKKYWLVL
ncbi:unnamed protein product [marine sediment metagenome]|uniref:Uncharacterized protein n=1 Tax=marine sediment metagenome TaxID=412755 RepID=X0UKR0_9ZZZZ